MNSNRSYLDSLNARRQRRHHTSLDDLNRTVTELEERLRESERDAHRPTVPAEREAYARRAERLSGSSDRHHPAAYEPLFAARPAGERVNQDAAAIGRLAAELKALRDDLRHQVPAGMRGEFEKLRGEIGRARSVSDGDELGAELERLSGAIHALSERNDDRALNLLRLDLEQVRSSLEELAREDTVRSMERRWDEIDQRWHEIERRMPDATAFDPALSALAARLDQINDAVSNLPESLSLQSLEEKVRTLAAAIDHFSRQKERATPQNYELIEDRLDEISRAIAAATAIWSQPPSFEQIERIEARITGLARQIDELTEDRGSSAVLAERITYLAQRVEEMAGRAVAPDPAIERLGEQLAIINRKLDAGASTTGGEAILDSIERRFAEVAAYLEERQDDAAARGQNLFRELDARLASLSQRLDERLSAASSDAPALIETIDRRFAELSDQLGAQGEMPNAIFLESIEARLDEMARRLAEGGNRAAQVDPALLEGLEAQVADLAAQLSRPATAGDHGIDAITPRLAGIEQSISGQRENLVEAAREAATQAVRAFVESRGDAGDTSAIADELRALEALARRSEERNARTFEAIHDTLLKVVDRLGAMEGDTRAPKRSRVEDAPPLAPSVAEAPGEDGVASAALRAQYRTTQPRSPAEAAAAAASAAIEAERLDDDRRAMVEPAPGNPTGTEPGRGLLGGLSRVLPGRKAGQKPAAEAIEPVLGGDEDRSESLEVPLVPDAEDRPLEPGSGAPDLHAIMKRVRDERAGTPAAGESPVAKSDFIAAARRAAQAAAAEAEALKKNAEQGAPKRKFGPAELIRTQRKPILMATTAIVIALAGLQLGKAFFRETGQAAITIQPEPTSLVAKAMPEATGEPAQSEAPRNDAAAAVRVIDGDDGDDTDEAAIAPATGEEAGAATEAETDEASEVADEAPEAGASLEVASLPSDTSLPEPEIAEPRYPPAPVEAGPLPLREAADEGDAVAMFEIGSRYADGRGVTADMAEAAKWYLRAAEAGFAPAQYRIGNILEKGVGVERDIKQAKTWYQLAANQGNASAMHNLAVLFAMGADGTTDNDSAARWFIRAAELGVKDSQFNLGILSAKGIGVPQSLEESYKWFALVAKTGDKDAATKRDEVANALRPEQLERARAATELWKPKPLDEDANAVTVADEWRESNERTASLDMKKAVLTVQAILNKNGYEAGPADGIMGERTKQAIASFQKDNDMPATGEIDETFVEALLKRK